MKLLSDISRDGRTRDKSPGGYEWWYFDALDPERELRLVVIFYEGNPFSRRYIEARHSGAARPEHYPAVSISLYRGGRTLYCSFSEHEPGHAHFGVGDASLQVAGHRVEAVAGEGEPRYRLALSEELPSGDTLEGEFVFRGPAPHPGLFGEGDEGDGGHAWNLAMPRARVQGELTHWNPLEGERRITFEGHGYHDHNTGAEPIRNAFREWYWGRFHFDAGTLVCYALEGARDNRTAGGDGEAAHRAWLIAPDASHVVARFDQVRLEDRQRSLFGLRTARRMVLEGDGPHVTIQHEKVLDSGPFYQRFASRAFLRLPGPSAVDTQPGIAEYLCPGRIHRRLFWPLVNMRIRYMAEGPHWVQRSPRLYRWTW